MPLHLLGGLSGYSPMPRRAPFLRYLQLQAAILKEPTPVATLCRMRKWVDQVYMRGTENWQNDCGDGPLIK